MKEKKRTHKTEKREEKDDENEKEIEVHTANNWEKADLGDEDRKLKFLKLMGAAKVIFFVEV